MTYNLKRLIPAAVCLCIMTPQWALAQVQEVDQTDKIKALKIELEERKSYRDRVIAKRWDDKRKHNISREKFNQHYDELKDKLQGVNSIRERLVEEVESLRKDVEELKGTLEGVKVQFLGLSHLQHAAVQKISTDLDRRFPARIPQRQARINQAKKSLDVKQESPSDIFEDLKALYMEELAITREIVLEKKGFLMSDHTPGQGWLLRLGMVASAYKDDNTGRKGLMLRTGNISDRLFEWREDLPASVQGAITQVFENLTSAAPAKTAFLPVDVLRTRAVGQGYTTGGKKGFIGASIVYLKAGGIWMWPLGLIALAAVLLLIERLFYWWPRRAGGPGLYDQVLARALEDKVSEAVKLCASHDKNPVLRAMASVLNCKGKSRQSAEKVLQEVLLQEAPALEKRLTTVSVLGAAAPLLGLLGTVAGMIKLFETITIYGTSDPKLMASGISIALITTQTGLAIAVPIMIIHNFLANRVDGLVNQVEAYALKTLNILWPKG